ncbi:MAG: helix-turn-helix domain-containing protein [Hyphomicrobiales bacterium]|nr:helix-turn-helix domain-containing protein [Hyphomicrobiales bacterium]
MILVYPIGSEIHCFSGADFEIHTISIDDDVLAQLCQNLELIFPSNKQRPEIFPVTQERILFLQQRLEFLRFPARPMQEHALYEALSTLVKLWIPFRSTRPSTPDGTRGEAAVASCLERLNAPGWETLSLNDLTAHAAVSERTLQYAFRERFGATPSEFVKMRRLNSVRSALMRSDRAAVKVGDIAAENGFWHIGQFAADYKRAFGEVPSATVSRSAAP